MKRTFLLALLAGGLVTAGLGARQNTAPTADALKALQLRSIGPALTTGRIADIEIDPKNPNVWYVASAFGGLWKTVNRGVTFTPIFDELLVAYPFHHASEANTRAVELAAEWAKQCGLDLGENSPRALAQAILVDRHDWPASVRGLLDGGTTHVVSLDAALTGITS